MKIKNLAISALAGIAMVSCSNDTPVDNHANTVKGEQYAYVQFVMPGEATRAEANSEEKKGAEDNGITSAEFFFFDDEGKQVANSYKVTNSSVKKEGGKDIETGDSNKKDLTNAIVVLEDATSIPTQMLVILNGINNTYGKSENRDGETLDKIKDITANYTTATTAGNFVMTNSVFVNAEGNVQTATPISSDDFKPTRDKARKSPVKVAVEKVVARVSVTKDEEFDNNNNSTKDMRLSDNLNAKDIKVDILGWWLDNTNEQSYLVKNLSAKYEGFDGWEWNNVDKKRSYWANPAEAKYKHYTFSTNMLDKYCQENTDQKNTTKIVVAAQIKVGEEATNLYRYQGIVYTEEDMHTKIFNKKEFKEEIQKYYVVKETTDTRVPAGTDEDSDEEYIPLSKEYKKYFKFKITTKFSEKKENSDLKSYQARITPTLNEGVTLYTKKDGKYEQVEDKVDFSDCAVKADLWKDGYTYYFVDIKHIEGSNMKAIIRNHFYKLNLKSIYGFGTAVPDGKPGEENPNTPEIIPVPMPNDHSYLGAQIEVLSYKEVTQDVALGEDENKRK